MYDEERKFYSEALAILYDYRANPRFKTIDLFRVFTVSRRGLQSSALEMFNNYVSAKNTTECDYVDDPMASEEEYPGRYRLISNSKFRDPNKPEQQGILQHLRLYRLTTILDAAAKIDFTMARTIDMDYSSGNNNEFYASGLYSADPARLQVIEWAAIHPSKVASVISEFSSNFSTSTSFTLDGETYTGLKYIFAAVSDNATDNDGTKTIRFTIGRPEYVLKYQGSLLSSRAFTGYTLWGLTKQEAQTVIDTVIASQTQGISITPDYNASLHTAILRLRVRDSLDGIYSNFQGSVSCSQTDKVALYNGYTKDALAVLLLELAGQVSSGVWFTVSGFSEDDDGLFNCAVTKHTAIGIYVPEHVSGLSNLVKRNSEQALNQKTIGSIYLPTDTVQGVQYRRTIRKNDNCTYDISVDTDLSVAANLTALTGDNLTEQEQTTLYANSRSIIEASEGDQGSLYRASNTLNPDGTYNGQLLYGYSKEHSFSALTGDNLTEQEQTTLYVNSRNVIEASEGDQGSLYRASNILNPDGTYNGQLLYGYSKGHSFSALTGDNLTEQEQTTLYANSRSIIEASEGDQGSLYRASNTLNPDGTYNGQLLYGYLKEHSFDFRSQDTLLDQINSTIYANNRSRIEAPSYTTPGGIYEADSTMGKDGTYSGRLVYHGTKDNDIYYTWTTRGGIASTHKYQNSRSIPSLPSSKATSNSVSINALKDGTYDVVINRRPFSSGATGGTIVFTTDEIYEIHRRYSDKYEEYQDYRVYHKIRCTTSRDKADEFIDGGVTGSNIRKDGRNYIATRYWITFPSGWVTINKTLVGDEADQGSSA